MLLILGVLDLTGLVMVLSSSAVLSLQQYGNPWYEAERQALWIAIGTIAFFVALRVDRRRWRRFARPAMVVAIVMLLAVLVPHVGVRVGGASRWLGVSSLRVQPSELAKLALVFFAADTLDRRSERGAKGDWRYQMGPVLAIVGILAVLVMAQPDMGTTAVLVVIALAMVGTAGLPPKPFAAILATGGVLGLLMAVVAPYRWRRLTAFVHPFAHARGSGFQSVQGLVALGSGRLLGKGIGSSLASWGYLPNASTDFIFAIVGEETGLVGAVLLAGLYLALGVVGVRIACGARDRFSGYLAAGITAWLLGQAVINIGAVVGLLPVTGVPLPFVSFGGSSLVVEMFAAGVLGNIARRP
ncbi:MAG: putative lipid II flippase FtsW [Actinomycetota bacterium]|nr:putative lipid II flippase FtsW [Actinomycetota bacterium]